MKRLYRLFVAFTIFNLLTISAALYIEHHVTRDYTLSLAASERFMDRIAAYNTLEELAGSVDAPPNNVFLDKQLEKNERLLEAAVTRFTEALIEARKETMSESPARAKAIMAQLDKVDRLMAGVVTDGRRVFTILEAGGGSDGAMASMALTDRGYAKLQRELSVIDELAREFQKDEFQQQVRHLTLLRQYEYIVALLIALGVLATALYGRGLLRQVLAIEQRREQSLSELQSREEELRRANVAFANAMEGISFLDADRRYTFVNRAYAETLGYEPDQLIGAHVDATIHPDDVGTMLAAYREMREQGKAECDVRALAKDGAVVDTHVMIVATHDEHGQFLGHYRFIKDVTEQKRAESALRRSEERFNLAARATNDIIFEWDLKTAACWCNEAMSQFGTGVSGDVDLTAWSDAVHPEDRDRVLTVIQAAIAAGKQFWSIDYRFRKVDGAYADMTSHGYVVHSATREPLRVVGVTMDITARKRAERSYNTQMLNSTADGIFGLDLEGNATFVNTSAARVFGWTVDELVGKNMHQMIHHHYPDGRNYPIEECPTYVTRATGVAGGSDQEVFWRKDGSKIPVEYGTTAIRDGEGQVVGSVVTFRDIGARRTVERMKDEFVSVVSHELRTPLTSIRGALGLLAAGRLGDIPEKGKRMLDIAVSNTDRLVRLINDILDIERMESGKITLTRQLCDSYELMSQAIELIRPIAEKADITLRCTPCDVRLWADPDRLLQTFSNLLSNAVKFSPPRAVVSLSATVADGNVVFEVADEGRGIPADKLDLIFERFQQVDASDSREKGGSGLGLAICRSIVRQHGGEIYAESTPGKGSRFRFTIPGLVAVVTKSSTDRTVVVCDDDPSIREILCTLLEQQGHRAVGVASGRELLNRVSTLAPDMILLDLLMPDMNGVETLAALKARPETASIPVVITSVFSPDESDWPFSDLAGWVQKPLDERTLFNAVELALHRTGRRQILLIEDDLDLARVVTEGFERHGVEVVHAASGAAAIELAQKTFPDLVILDLVLPDMDGFAVVDWLKDHDRLRSVPMIVYSAMEPSPSQRQRLALGPTEFLTKSRILPEEFERRVIQLLDKMIVTTKGALPNVA